MVRDGGRNDDPANSAAAEEAPSSNLRKLTRTGRQFSEEIVPPDARIGNGIDWSRLDQRLYGRETEGKCLLDAFQRCCCTVVGDQRKTGTDDRNSELVLLTGSSGTGKTVLATAVLCSEVRRRGGFFVSGKFDQLARSEQYYPIVQAFADFVKQARLRDDSTLLSIQNAVRPIVETDSALTDMLPALKELVDLKDTVSDNVKGPNAESLLLQTFCRFIRSVSSHSRPLVLFLGTFFRVVPLKLPVIGKDTL